MKPIKSLLNLLCLTTALGTAVPVVADTAASSAPMTVKSTSVESPLGSKVNINTASAEEIAAGLNGIGAKKAAEIVHYREANGPFKDTAELLKIKGIGEATLKKNESILSL